MVDFKQDLQDSVVATLNKYNVKHKDKDDLHALLVRLCTFWDKYIIPKPRTVLISRELSEGLESFPETVRIAVNKMLQWVEAGVDINCFQGRGLYGKGSRDYQNTLYSIVHLHLSASKNDSAPIIKKDGFAKPSAYLLYAYFTDTHAYFIDVQKHPEAFDADGNIAVEWISKNLLQIVDYNWPELLKHQKIDGMTLCDSEGNPIELDDKARSCLFTHGINTGIELDGAVYLPSFGVTSSGDSLRAVMYANRMINSAVMAELKYTNHKEFIHKTFRYLLQKHGRPIPLTFDIHYDYVPCVDQFLILDRCSSAAYHYQNDQFNLFK